jgi:hypothetical protein
MQEEIISRFNVLEQRLFSPLCRSTIPQCYSGTPPNTLPQKPPESQSKVQLELGAGRGLQSLRYGRAEPVLKPHTSTAESAVAAKPAEEPAVRIEEEINENSEEAEADEAETVKGFNSAANSVQQLQLHENGAATKDQQKEAHLQAASAVSVVLSHPLHSQSVGLIASPLSFAPSAAVTADLFFNDDGGGDKLLERDTSYLSSRPSTLLMEFNGSGSTLNSSSGAGRTANDTSSGQGSRATAVPLGPAHLGFRHFDLAGL